jgi:L-fucono-1,5-lactonase
VPGRSFTVDEVRPAWEVALELFGPERLMWGSDWPITVLVGGYGHAWDVMSSLIGELSDDEQERILCGTATAVYR